jgi:kynurenine formamidase
MVRPYKGEVFMMITIELSAEKYQLDITSPISLAIPVEFISPKNITSDQNEVQPNHFSANLASSKPMQIGSFIGNTEQGGSCNVNELTINPHCNGTHTETIAHICDLNHRYSKTIAEISHFPLMPCVLVSIKPKPMNSTNESYAPALQKEDLLITRSALESLLANYSDIQLQCLVVRTLPNETGKRYQAYSQSNQPPFFSREAIIYLNKRGVEHLVLDLPSLDRLHDDGLLTCHHLFWQVEEGSHQANEKSLVNKTITEMAFISNQLSDGFYFINLQVPLFVTDAVPSNPVLYNCKNIVSHNKIIENDYDY